MAIEDDYVREIEKYGHKLLDISTRRLLTKLLQRGDFTTTLLS
jgi:hypothetical protein